MPDEKKLGVKIVSSLTGRGFQDTRDEAVKTQSAVSASAEKMSRDYEQSLEKIRNKAAIAFAAVAAGIGVAVKAAGDQEAALIRAQSAVEISGGTWSEWDAKVQKASSDLQSITRFADEQFAATFADITLLTGSAAKGFEGMGLAADLAAGLHMDLESATRYVAIAMSGEVGMLSRYVPALRQMDEELGKNATQAEKAAYITNILRQQFGGLAEREAKSLHGQMAQVKNIIGDAGEEIGNAFIPSVKLAAGKIKEIAFNTGDWVKRNEEVVETWVEWGVRSAVVIGAIEALVLAIKAYRIATQTALIVTQALSGPKGWAALAGGLAAVAGGLIAAEALINKFEEGVGGVNKELTVAANRSQEVAEKMAWLVSMGYSETEALNMIEAAYKSLEPKITKATEALSEQEKKFQSIIAIAASGDFSRYQFTPQENPDIDFGAEDQARAFEQMQNNYVAWVTQVQATEQETSDKKKALWEQESAAWDRHNAALISAYKVGVDSIIATDMTGKARREAIWDAFKKTAIRQVGDIVLATIKGEALKKSAILSTAAAGIAAGAAWVATELAHIATAIAGWIKLIYVKMVAFYSFLGPFAIPAALVTMTAVAAAMVNVAKQFSGMQEGGIVGGYGFGDKQPRLLEVGERVISRNEYRANAPAIENAVAGGAGGGIYNITVNAERQLSVGDMLNIRRMIEDMLPDSLDRALNQRRLSPAFAGAR